jgi:type I restriction enzyme S subunit
MNTKQLRQKIIDLAIRGKLVAQDPDDEPASALLERVRVEKERLIKEGKIRRGKGNSAITFTGDKSHYEKIDERDACIDDQIPLDESPQFALSENNKITK